MDQLMNQSEIALTENNFKMRVLVIWKIFQKPGLYSQSLVVLFKKIDAIYVYQILL